MNTLVEPQSGADEANSTAQRNGEMLERVRQLRLDGNNANLKSKGSGSNWLPWILCGVMAVLWSTVAIRSYKTSPASEDGLTVRQASSGSTGQSTKSTGDTSRTKSGAASQSQVQLEIKGNLDSNVTVTVSPIEVSGRVVELNVIEGKLVQKGDLLAKIDDTNFRAAAKEAEASLKAAQNRMQAAEYRLEELKPDSVREVEIRQLQAELEEAEAAKIRAEDDFERFKNLPTGIAARELVQARADFLTSSARVSRLKASLEILIEGPRKETIAAGKADLEAARAEVIAAEARHALAKWRLDNCEIRAPITGTILTKSAELGDLVNPLAFSAGSGAICKMADLNDLEVKLDIPERDISKIRLNQPCRIRADAYPSRPYEGYLDRIMPTANTGNSTIEALVKVKLPEGEVPGTYLKIGMGAVVTFLAPDNE